MDMRSLIHEGSFCSSSSSSSSSCSSVVSSSATIISTSNKSNGSDPAPIVSLALPVPPFTVTRPQPTIFQRSTVPNTISQAPTLAPLRFIIPNGNSFSHNGAASDPSTTRPVFNMNEPEREPQPQHSMLCPQDRYAIKTEQQQQLSRTLNDQKQSKKVTPKRTRTIKLSSRSTKSKARPGLRKGKWTEEESRYATQLTNYFKDGLLPLERGTMLRLYLSQKLNCEPMRITKKFTGGGCIGKQVFRPCSLTPESRVRIMQAQLELVTLETAFIKRLKENREDPPIPTNEFDVRPTSFGYRSRPVPLKPRMYESGEDDDKDEDVEDANAVGLLLDFFYKANRNEKKGDKKAAFTKKDESSAEDFKKEIEGAQTKKSSTEICTPTSPTTNSERDTSINSPTKRMRALSVSGCVDPATSKRSRVGSFSAATAV